MILVAQPVRRGVNPEYLRLAEQHFAAMQGNFERIVWENGPWSTDGRKYWVHAQARNAFIEAFLRPEHSWVWWVDIDMEAVAAGTLVQLLAAAEAHDAPVIMAPSVYVAMRRPNRSASMQNGGWFYDVGGFTTGPDDAPRWIDMWRGLPGRDVEVEMTSVGCGKLVPAWLYRAGLRYAPRTSFEVEHVGFCVEARRQFGVRSFARRDVRIEHVYLPDYGEGWH